MIRDHRRAAIVIVALAVSCGSMAFAQQPACTIPKVRIGAMAVETGTGNRHVDAIHEALYDTRCQDQVEVKLMSYVNEARGAELLLRHLDGTIDDKDKVDIVLGPTDSGVFVQAVETFGTNTDNVLPVISSLVTAEIPNRPQGWFFRTNVDVTRRANAISDYLSKFWVRRITVLYADTEFGRRAEEAFARSLRDFQREHYVALPYEYARNTRTELASVLKSRPEAVGILGEREDIEVIVQEIKAMNSQGTPYLPMYFTILDARTIYRKVDDIYFVAVTDPEATAAAEEGNPESEAGPIPPCVGKDGPPPPPATVAGAAGKYDDVKALSYDTTLLVVQALSKFPRAEFHAVDFRDRMVSKLRGEAESPGPKSGMSFVDYENSTQPRVYHLSGGTLCSEDLTRVVPFSRIMSRKYELVRDRYGRRPGWYLLGLLAVVVAVSLSDLQRWHIGGLRELFRPPGNRRWYDLRRRWHVVYFLIYIGASYLIAAFSYVAICELGVAHYDNLWMVLALGLAPSTLLKASFFETPGGKSIGLAEYHNRVMVWLLEQVRLGQRKTIEQNAAVVAQFNSLRGLERGLNEILRNTRTVTQRKRFEAQVEEELRETDSNFGKRKVYARWLLRVATWNQLQAIGCVPAHLTEEQEKGDPLGTIASAVQHCVKSLDCRQIADRLLNKHLAESDESTLAHYKAKMADMVSERDKMFVRIQMLHLRFDYDAERLRLAGLLPPRDVVEGHPDRLPPYRDRRISISLYDKSPLLHVDGQHLMTRFDPAAERFRTYHLPYTGYSSLKDVAKDHIDFYPEGAPGPTDRKAEKGGS